MGLITRSDDERIEKGVGFQEEGLYRLSLVATLQRAESAEKERDRLAERVR